MSRRRRFPLSVLAFALLVLCARQAYGCSCGKKPTVLEAYEWADVVVVARAVSLEVAPEKGEAGAPGEEEEDEEAESDEKDDERRRAVSTKMLAERVYKGGVKVGEEMVFVQGTPCGFTFDGDDIGQSYLFYLKRIKGADFWVAGACGRSSRVAGARDDLLYLNNMPGARGRTRVSGTLECFTAEGPDVSGLKILLRGGGKTFEARTDEHGVYEIYDVPAGKYTLEPEIPRGWKVGSFWLGYSASFAGDDEEHAPKRIPIVVEEKKHAALDILFEIDNAVAGKVFDPQGRPRDGVCLQLLPARGEVPKSYYKGTCTENGGRFRIDEIPPGDYVLVINREGKVTSGEPFGTVYYPNAGTREEATVFHVGLGDFVENLEFRIARVEETVTVEGLFLYSDGRPVADEVVEFRAEKNGEEEADSRTRTDARGRFTLEILKGQRGSAYGRMHTYVGRFENCPRLDALVRQTGRDEAEMKTPAVEIQADGDLYGVELRFPFPGCKKAKN
jgi:hypothetical protein